MAVHLCTCPGACVVANGTAHQLWLSVLVITAFSWSLGVDIRVPT